MQLLTHTLDLPALQFDGCRRNTWTDVLSLSVKTIERHVENILMKPDVTSRVAATASAYENEVVRPPG